MRNEEDEEELDEIHETLQSGLNSTDGSSLIFLYTLLWELSSILIGRSPTLLRFHWSRDTKCWIIFMNLEDSFRTWKPSILCLELVLYDIREQAKQHHENISTLWWFRARPMRILDISPGNTIQTSPHQSPQLNAWKLNWGGAVVCFESKYETFLDMKCCHNFDKRPVLHNTSKHGILLKAGHSF